MKKKYMNRKIQRHLKRSVLKIIENLVFRCGALIGLSHPDEITVDVADLKMGVSESDLNWWNWEAYTESWRLVDENPKRLAKTLPLYSVVKRVSERHWRIDDVELHIMRATKVYQEIKRNGYDPDKGEPITVNIRGDGSIHVNNGHHRVSMLKHLTNPQRITVKVNRRYLKWLILKIITYILYREKRLYQPIPQPDFVDWRVMHPCTDRLGEILGFIDEVQNKRVLDVGSCTGWFSCALASLGARVVGIERTGKRVWIARKIAAYKGLKDNPVFIKGTFEDYLKRRPCYIFDVTLFLSLFHHYLRREIDEAWAVADLLSRHSKVMFLDLGVDRLPIKWRPELIIEHSEFKGFKKLRSGMSKRPFYAYYKSEV